MAKQTNDTLFDAKSGSNSHSPVECLGMTFPNDEARRAYFTEKLREKLKDPTFRKIEGFSIGGDENILAMSDPPYYTACPNPFIGEFLKTVGTVYSASVKAHREPFCSDVEEGKKDPLYTAHAYHTKVPHKAIMRYILHYTQPGDVVFDGFSGTGMTGVAAQLCGVRREVEELGYRVSQSGQIHRDGLPDSALGARRAVLNDLSPAATFIAANYNSPVDAKEFEQQAKRILSEVEEEFGWMYETLHKDGKTKGRINYTVWSDVFSCGECGKEIVFTNEALDKKSGAVRETFPCPHCGIETKKDDLELRYESVMDKVLGETISIPKRVPVLICYTVKREKYEKTPDASDLALIRRIADLSLPSHLPTLELPDMQMRKVGRMQPAKITHIHHFFLARATHILPALWERASRVVDHRNRNALLFFVEQAIWGMSLLARYVPTHYSQVNQYLSGVFYVASQIVDPSPWYILDGKLKRLAKVFQTHQVHDGQSLVTTQDLAHVGLADNSIDYIFTDPPFGENIYYSDLNILVESWHGVRTAPTNEVIVDKVKEKTLLDYQRMMSNCFCNYYRVLKPGRWMTVEFHNSRNSVWNAIQEALQHAGFVVADVRTLDKKQHSFQQAVSGNTVKRDLIISAYKPNGGLEERFEKQAGTEEGVWDFVSTHLKQLPVFVAKAGKAESLAERQGHVLFDRMVAFHVQRGYPIPMSTPEFLAGIRQKYPEQDGMHFLPDQVAEYAKKRLEVKEVEQLQLFVSDEKSAIQWVRLQIAATPMAFGVLQPLFQKHIGTNWETSEKSIELLDLLKQNFIEEKGKWHVPDPKNEAHLEQLRHAMLLKEFQDYQVFAGKLRKVRTEALRAGFKEAWQKKDFKTITQMAKRVSEAVIQDDQALLMYFDNASVMLGE